MRITRRFLLKAAAISAALPRKGHAALTGFVGAASSGGGGVLTTRTLVNNGGGTMAVGTVSPQFTLGFVKGDIPAALQTTGNITSGSNQLTGLASTAGIVANQPIGIAGVPGGTYVVSVVGSTVTMSANATASGTGVRVVFFGTPLLTVGGVSQPLSIGSHVPWSDGSLKLCSVMFRSTFSLAASASQTVNVSAGGTPPTMGQRTLATDVYPQSVIVTITGAKNSGTAITGANLTGSLSAWLDAPANTNNNNWHQDIYCDGDAGTVWKVRSHMSTTKTGAAHGQLEVSHYVAALTDGSGNLGGLRYLPCLEQPFYNGTGALNLYGLDIVTNPPTWQYGAGPTTTNFTWPHNSHTFTVASGAAATDTANNYWTGTQTGSNVMACYVTATANGLTANKLYIFTAQQNTGPNNNIAFYDSATQTQITLTGSGSNTIVPIPWLNPFGRLFSATSDARWNEFQGTGSGNTGSAAALQVQYDQTYLHQTGLLPPYDMSLLGSITGDYSSFWGLTNAYKDFSPMSIVDFTQGASATGEHDDLGPLPRGYAWHFFAQTANNDKYVRMGGLGYANFQENFRDSTTGNIPNFNGPSLSYGGMPAYQGPATGGTDLVWGGNNVAGFTGPNTQYNWLVLGTEHKGNGPYYPYLVTGEPQNLDMAVEQGSQAILNPPNFTRNPSAPTTAYGLITADANEPRVLGWALRDAVLGAIVTPMSAPDGSQVYQYWADQITNEFSWLASELVAANNFYDTSTSWICTNSMWTSATKNAATGNWLWGVMATFQLSFFRFACCWAAKALESSDALSFVQSMTARDNHIFNTFPGTGQGGWILHGSYENTYTSDSVGSTVGHPLIGSDAQWGMLVGGSSGICTGSITYTNSGSPYFAWDGLGNGLTQLSVGDVLNFQAGASYPSELTNGTPYYMRDVVNAGGGIWKFNLATGSASNPAIVIASGSSFIFLNRIFYAPQNPPAASTGYTASTLNSGNENAISYCAINYAAELWGHACGDGGNTAISGDAHTRLTSGTATWATDILSNPKYAMQATF